MGDAEDDHCVMGTTQDLGISHFQKFEPLSYLLRYRRHGYDGDGRFGSVEYTIPSNILCAFNFICSVATQVIYTARW